MTRDEILEAAATMIAFANGAVIESTDFEDDDWREDDDPDWDFLSQDYRIKRSETSTVDRIKSAARLLTKATLTPDQDRAVAILLSSLKRFEGCVPVPVDVYTKLCKSHLQLDADDLSKYLTANEVRQ